MITENAKTILLPLRDNKNKGWLARYSAGITLVKLSLASAQQPAEKVAGVPVFPQL